MRTAMVVVERSLTVTVTVTAVTAVVAPSEELPFCCVSASLPSVCLCPTAVIIGTHTHTHMHPRGGGSHHPSFAHPPAAEAATFHLGTDNYCSDIVADPEPDISLMDGRGG